MASFGLALPGWGQTSSPLPAKGMASAQRVHHLEVLIKHLYKQIGDGVKKGTLSGQKADELSAQVDALQDKKADFMRLNGAHRLTDLQLRDLEELWKTAQRNINRARFPEGRHPRVTFRGQATPATH